MLGEIFYWVFNMSLSTAVCIFPILIIRKIKRIPRRIIVLLWLIPIIRMLIPVGITGKYGIMAFISRFTTKTVTVYEPNNGISFTMMNHVMKADSYFPITYRVDILQKIFLYASYIWIIIAILLLCAFFIIYRKTIKEMKKSDNLKDNIFFSWDVKTPAVYGIIKPKIIIPYGFDESLLEFVILHEQTHIKRLDNLLRIVALISVCIHWFNPISWIFIKLLFQDIELACDERVLSKCNDEQRYSYAKALVLSVEKTNVFSVPFGGAKIKTRIQSIVSYKKLTFISFLSFSVLILLVAYFLLTNAN